jgi:dihydroneopterin aldolase
MVFYGYHGVVPEERTLGQRFIVDLDITADLRAAGTSDDLAHTLNYAEAFRLVEGLVTGPPFQLIEALAERIAAVVLEAFPPAQAVAVHVRKPSPPIPGAVFSSAEVWIERARG